MSQYVNVGALIAGERPRTKKALREAIAVAPEVVTFDVTEYGRPGDTVRCTAASIGTDKLSVVGPDPFTSRNWYATVQVVRGKVQIS